MEYVPGIDAETALQARRDFRGLSFAGLLPQSTLSPSDTIAYASAQALCALAGSVAEIAAHLRHN
jgi:hypothetical protein